MYNILWWRILLKGNFDIDSNNAMKQKMLNKRSHMYDKISSERMLTNMPMKTKDFCIKPGTQFSIQSSSKFEQGKVHKQFLEMEGTVLDWDSSHVQWKKAGGPGDTQNPLCFWLWCKVSSLVKHNHWNRDREKRI